MRRLALALVLMGCGSSGPVPLPSVGRSGPEATATSTVDASAPLVLTLGSAAPITLTHASAGIGFDPDDLEVQVTEVPLAESGLVERGAAMSFRVMAGPGRRYFTGAPCPVVVQVTSRSVDLDGAPSSMHEAHVDIRPFEPVMGAVVQGTVDASFETTAGRAELHGGFRVVLSSVYPTSTEPAPSTVSGAPVAGSLDGAPFTLVTALAVLAHVGGETLVEQVHFFGTSGIDCEGLNARLYESHLTIGGVGSTSYPSYLRPELGRPVPVAAGVGQGRGSIGFELGYSPPAWVRVEQASLVEGGHVRGSLYVRDRPRDDASSRTEVLGTFDALVCEPRELPFVPLPG